MNVLRPATLCLVLAISCSTGHAKPEKTQKAKAGAAQNAKRVFKALDKDKDGFLSFKEFKAQPEFAGKHQGKKAAKNRHGKKKHQEKQQKKAKKHRRKAAQ